MKMLIFSLLSLSLCSCAILEKVAIIKYDYNRIHLGSPATEAIALRGEPSQMYSYNHESIYLYADGYIHFKDQKVLKRGPYEFMLSANEPLAPSVLNGESVFGLLPRLGMPLKIQYKDNSSIVYYNRAAILVEGNTVVVGVDKTYSDLVFNLDINAFTDHSVSQKGKYYIIPGSQDLNPEDFQFKEFKSMLSGSMRIQGLNVTDNPNEADYVIFVNYGISDPKEDIKVISRPIYIPSYIPGNTVNFYGSSGGYLGSAQSAGSWSAQYAGQHTETYKTVSYSRWLNIEAADYGHLKKTGSIRPVWKVLTASVGSSGDLRYVLPALTFGAMNFIDTDSLRELRFQASSETLNEFIYNVKFVRTSKRNIAGKK